MARGARGGKGRPGARGSLIVENEKLPMFLRSSLPGRNKRENELVEGVEGHYARRDTLLYWATTIDATYGDTTSVVTRSIAQTPLFDLRYDLGLVDGIIGPTSTIRRKTMIGIQFDLFTTLTGFATILTGGAGVTPIRITKLEFGHVSDPQRSGFFTEPEDVSLDVYSGNSISGFSALHVPVAGPLRYWGVAYIFDTFAGSASTAGTHYASALH